MTSRAKLSPTLKKVKQPPKKVKSKPVYKSNDLVERMSKYILVSK